LDRVQGRFELTLVRFCPIRLPRKYSSALVACVYIQEFNNPPVQTSAVYELIYILSETILSKPGNGKPLLYICGDFKGADL